MKTGEEAHPVCCTRACRTTVGYCVAALQRDREADRDRRIEGVSGDRYGMATTPTDARFAAGDVKLPVQSSSANIADVAALLSIGTGFRCGCTLWQCLGMFGGRRLWWW